jgi:hypothetical protein
MSIEEASKKVFNDLVKGFEKDTAKVFNDPEDRETLRGMIEEWRRLRARRVEGSVQDGRGSHQGCRESLPQSLDLNYYTLCLLATNVIDVNPTDEDPLG